MQDIRIAVRVTAKEKDKIQSKARKCGLSTTEYVKQRALGYEPRGIPPDALFLCLEIYVWYQLHTHDFQIGYLIMLFDYYTAQLYRFDLQAIHR